MDKRFTGICVVPKPNEPPDRYIKRFTNKVRESKVLDEYRSRTSYCKPSVRRRMKEAKALYRLLKAS